MRELLFSCLLAASAFEQARTFLGRGESAGGS